MATIYFGANLYPGGIAPNGNWGDINQWFSNPGDNSSKSPFYATPLGRLPYNTDSVYLYQAVNSNVGYWNGTYPLGSYVTGSFAGNITLGQINSGVTATFSGTLNNVNAYGGTYSGTLSSCTLGNATYSGTITIGLTSTGTPTITGTITNISGFSMVGGTWTFPLGSSVWSSNPLNNFIDIRGGTFNPSTLSNSYHSVYLLAGTILVSNLFSGSNLDTANVFGATDLSIYSSSGITLGSLTKGVRTNLWNGSNIAYTIYQKTSGTGTTINGFNGGTYTGLITIIPTTGSTNPVSATWTTGSVYNPTAIIPLINKSGYTGKGIASIPPTYGAPSYTPNIYISGSSDILQSELA